MDKIVKYNSISFLKKTSDPIIVVAAVDEAEAIIKACEELKIKISGVCDSEKRKSEKPLAEIKVFHNSLSTHPRVCGTINWFGI